MLATIFQTGQGTNTLLSLLTFVPLPSMIEILCVPKAKQDVSKAIAAAATRIPFVISIIIYFTYDKSGTGVEASQMYLVERYDWIPSYNISYYLGVDGLSVPILLLSCLLFFFAVFSAWGIEKGVKGFFSLLLLLEVGTNGSSGFMDPITANGGGIGGIKSTDSHIVKRTRFVIELAPQLGSPLTIQRAVPPGLRNVMNLN